MTIPQRGLWRNSVLGGVLSHHSQVMQRVSSNKVVKPIQDFAHPMDKTPPAPDKVHHNSLGLKSALPGHPKDQHPAPREPRASKNANRQAHATRQRLKFIPGTASALSAQVQANAKSVGEV